jgi:hypothetical protein
MKKIIAKFLYKKNRILATALLSAALVMSGCGAETVGSALSQSMDSEVSQETADTLVKNNNTGNEVTTSSGSSNTEDYLSSAGTIASTSTLIDTTEIFTERDLEQNPDLTDAAYITLASNEDVNITEEGVYVITGTATQSSIIVDADSAKVQLVLDGVSITNSNSPAIYVKNADKVFITTTDSDNTLTVNGTFSADGTTNTDAVIYSKDDLVLNGTGTLTISSTANGITGKDDLKFTGGTYTITSTEDAIEANDSIRISDGTYNITSKKDGLHSENSDDDTVGYVYISGGTFNIKATEDGIQATTVLQIDGGTLDINAAEGLEGTYVQINDGTINISASDDGINATSKSTAYDVVIMINGGNLAINMGSGDTDALDANGDLIINGGTIDITAQFAFDYDKNAELNGGTVTVNGEEITEISNSMMMGGGGFGGFGGRGGQGGQGGRGGQNQSGQVPSGEAPEDFDPSQLPEGFDPSQAPEGFDPSNAPSDFQPGQAPNGKFKNGGEKSTQSDT